jgi:hypothetical protein
MTEPLTLFDQPQVTGRHRRNDLRPSVEAARANRPQRLNLNERVRLLLVRAGDHGLTVDDLAAQFDYAVQRNVLARRCSDLLENGQAVKAGERVGPTGRRVTVWTAAEVTGA